MTAPTVSYGAIAFVGATTAEAEAGSGPTLSHNFGSGAHTIAIVVRCIRETGGAVAADTAVPTLGGNNMTQITGVTNSGNVVRAEMYYYLSPGSGSQSIVSFPAATTDRNQTTVLEYTGVAHTSTFGTPVTAQGSTVDINVDSISSAVGELGILGACLRRSTVSPPSTVSADAATPVSTERVDVAHSQTTSTTIAAYEEAGAATSIDMRIDSNDAVQYAAIGVSMRAAADATVRPRSPVVFP